MKTEHHIAQLLYRYQCVTVPGFGAFLSETQSAQLHENANAFYPPKKLISFNSYLKNNDGLLANHVAQVEKLSYEQAINSIEREVGIWKDSLHENGRFSIKNIGELTLNAEKNLVFTPSEQPNYLTDSFGLSSFVSPVVKREEYKETVETLEEKAPIQFTPEVRQKRSYLKYAAIFALALSVTGSIGYKVYSDQVSQNTLMVETEVQKEVQDKIQEATFLIESPLPSVTLTVREQKLSYHVVAGVFRSEENAENACQELKGLGYKARRIPKNRHRLYPVVYGSYATAQEAAIAMDTIRKSANKDAWLLVKEL
ncbi:MAG TPA: SPOR domain-containing protein [Flavobacterium sp.]|nr:SPOR domain-containing protein [Flavobacterium sp.]